MSIESIVRMCYNDAVTETLARILTRLNEELPSLLQSPGGWQLTLHGRGNHVRLEILRTDDITKPGIPPPPPKANSPAG